MNILLFIHSLLILLCAKQVYKGVTLDGEKVAIKVQYIDLQDRFMTDIKAIIYLLRVITVIHPKFDLHWVLNVSIQNIFISRIRYILISIRKYHTLIVISVSEKQVCGSLKKFFILAF